MLLEPPTVIMVPPHEQAAPVGTPPTPGSPMAFATPPQVGTTRLRPDSNMNMLPSGEHTRARLNSPPEPMMPMMPASGCEGGGGEGGGDSGGDGGGDGGGGGGGDGVPRDCNLGPIS